MRASCVKPSRALDKRLRAKRDILERKVGTFQNKAIDTNLSFA